MQAATTLQDGQKCVVLLPDSIRNYMTKFLDDQWMIDRGFKEEEGRLQHWWWNYKVSFLNLQTPVTVLPDISCEDAIDLMRREGFDQLPVVNENGKIFGVVTLGSLMSRLLSKKLQPTSPIQKGLYSQFRKISLDDTLGKLSRILERDHFSLVVHSQKLYVSQSEVQEREVIIGIVTQIDLLNLIAKVENPDESDLKSFISDQQSSSMSGRDTPTTEADE